MLRHDAGPAAHDGRIQGAADRSRSGRPISASPRVIVSPASCWSATPSRPPARPREPAPTRCSPTSGGSATSTSRVACDRRHGRGKIAAFYDDPEKTACDARCLAKAYHLRSLSIDNGLSWRAQRWARFIVRLAQGNRDRSASGLSSTDRFHARWRAQAVRASNRRGSRRGSVVVSILVVVIVVIVVVGLIGRADAACGSGRPRACDRRRWRRAAWRASRARSPCRPRSR